MYYLVVVRATGVEPVIPARRALPKRLRLPFRHTRTVREREHRPKCSLLPFVVVGGGPRMLEFRFMTRSVDFKAYINNGLLAVVSMTYRWRVCKRQCHLTDVLLTFQSDFPTKSFREQFFVGFHL